MLGDLRVALAMAGLGAVGGYALGGMAEDAKRYANIIGASFFVGGLVLTYLPGSARVRPRPRRCGFGVARCSIICGGTRAGR